MKPELKPDYETRYFALDSIELRAADEGADGPGTLVGYASVFNSRSEDLGGFVEQIAPGTFTRSIGMPDIFACPDHDESVRTVLGCTDARTLILSQDDRGLRFENPLPDTTTGRDIAVSAARGDVKKMSFAFRATLDEWDMRSDPPLRTVKDADLYHIAYVLRPAYTSTSAALRSLEAARAAAVEVPEPEQVTPAAEAVEPPAEESRDTPPETPEIPQASHPSLSLAEARLMLAEAEG
jgi:hypothetical protein